MTANSNQVHGLMVTYRSDSGMVGRSMPCEHHSMKFDEGLDAHALAEQGEDDAPEYRVSFWSRRDGVWLNEYVGITEADADEVLAWAEREAHGRHYTVWVRSEWVSDGVQDIRLYGADPKDVNGGNEPPWAKRPPEDSVPETH